MNAASPCLISVYEAAEIAGCSVKTIRRNMDCFIRRKIGRNYLINEDSLRGWMASRTKSPDPKMLRAYQRILQATHT